jgi:PST family polysaccharide transporter
MDFRKTAIRTLLANAAGGVVGIGMALAGYGVWSLIGQQLSSALAGACFLWSVSHYRPSLRISFKHLRDLFHVSSSVFSTSFLWFFTSRLDQIVIGRFAGVSILGLYTIAGKVPDFARNATQQPLADVSFPAITSLQDDHDQMNAFTYKGMQANAILSFAVFVGIAAIAPDLLPVLFGTKWAVAAGICSLLSLNALVGGMQIFFRPLLLASGGMRQWVTLNAIQCAGVAAACIGGIQFGVRYLVIGLILNGFFLIFLTLLFLRKKIGLSPAKYCLPCLIPALAALVMVGVIWVTASILPSNTTPVLRLGIKVVLGAISYVGIVWLLRPVELKNLISTVARSFSGAELTAAVPPLS